MPTSWAAEITSAVDKPLGESISTPSKPASFALWNGLSGSCPGSCRTCKLCGTGTSHQHSSQCLAAAATVGVGAAVEAGVIVEAVRLVVSRFPNLHQETFVDQVNSALVHLGSILYHVYRIVLCCVALIFTDVLQHQKHPMRLNHFRCSQPRASSWGAVAKSECGAMTNKLPSPPCAPPGKA